MIKPEPYNIVGAANTAIGAAINAVEVASLVEDQLEESTLVALNELIYGEHGLHKMHTIIHDLYKKERERYVPIKKCS